MLINYKSERLEVNLNWYIIPWIGHFFVRYSVYQIQQKETS